MYLIYYGEINKFDNVAYDSIRNLIYFFPKAIFLTHLKTYAILLLAMLLKRTNVRNRVLYPLLQHIATLSIISSELTKFINLYSILIIIQLYNTPCEKVLLKYDFAYFMGYASKTCCYTIPKT